MLPSINLSCRADDELAPWWVTLARHEQSRHPVQGAESYEMLDQQTREDLTALHFVTIDSESTQDMTMLFTSNLSSKMVRKPAGD